MISAIGSGGSSLPPQSITNSCFITPSCVAARPMPGASYIVSNMSSTSARTRRVDVADRLGRLAQARVGMDQDRSDAPSAEVGEAARLDKTAARLRARRRAGLTCRPAGPAVIAGVPPRSHMFDFDEIIDRRGTHCDEVGHDGAAATACSPDDGLAMWVADMDFRPPARGDGGAGGGGRPRRARLFRRRRAPTRRRSPAGWRAGTAGRSIRRRS